MNRNGPRMTKWVLLACTAATSVVWASCWPLCGPAAAGTAPQVSVSPSSVAPKDQYYSTTHGFAGTGAVVTVKVGPNKVLRPGWAVEVQECKPAPASLGDCDMLTTLGFDQLTKRRVLAKTDGSVTVHFLVWAPLPNKWDPGSVIRVGPGHPVALWIGDDPSHWATSGLVSAPVIVGTPGRHQNATKTAIGDASSGSSHAIVIVFGVAFLGVIAGVATTISGTRRRRAVPS